MFAIPGLALVVFLVYIRPQEIWPALGRVPWLYIALFLTAVGMAVDWRRGFSRLRGNPLLPWAIFYFLWSVLSLLVKAPWDLLRESLVSFVSLCFFVLVSGALQTTTALRSVTTVLLVSSLAITAVGVHQEFAPTGCVRESEDPSSDQLVPDGRACQSREDCYTSNVEAGIDYRCEHIGLLGTTSILGRVRYRGIMQDPNELALVVSIAVPFAIALFELRRTVPRLALMTLAAIAVGLCTVFTRSRSGQLAFMAVLGVYFLRRLGSKGIVLALLLAAPVLAFGGRSGQSADESTTSRYDAWQVGFELVRESPLIGAGKGQFTEYHERTAHNSVMLALGELGTVGLLLWTATIYVAFKLLLVLLLGQGTSPVIRVWATALLSSMTGLIVSAMFLSFSDHNVLWIFLGLVGALGAAAAELHPELKVRFGLRDLGAVIAIDAVTVAVLWLLVRNQPV